VESTSSVSIMQAVSEPANCSGGKTYCGRQHVSTQSCNIVIGSTTLIIFYCCCVVGVNILGLCSDEKGLCSGSVSTPLVSRPGQFFLW